MIKAVIFDCFGVVVGKGFWRVYDAAGGDSLKDADFIEDILYRANSGAISSSEFSEAVAKRIGITVDYYRDVVSREEYPNLELFEYIKTLTQSYKIGLLSNANKGVIERKISANLRILFDSIIVSGEVGVMKPDPEIYRMSVESLGVKFDEAIFVDDIQGYVDAASSLGMNGVLYSGIDSLKKDINKLKSDTSR